MKSKNKENKLSKEEKNAHDKYKKILKEASSPLDSKETAEQENSINPEQQKIKDLEDKILRMAADMENLRKRTEKEMDETRKYALTVFARDLLDVIDNLERAQKNIPNEELAKNELLKTISDGIKMTGSGLLGILEKHGIKSINPEKGEKFDHNFHQAVVELPSPDQEPGTIVHVMQSGYIIKDRLLRPAMVGVAKAMDSAEEAN